jgi:hypothetical protein
VVEKPNNVGCIKGLLTITGWWFKETWNFMTFQINWEFQKIPTDELHHFSEGWLNHQPD